MRDERYKHNKWFIGIIAALIIWIAIILNSDNPDDGWGALGLIFLLIGIIGFWPIDYLIHRKTVKKFRNKPVDIDPNFKTKRNWALALVAGGAIIYAIVGAISGD
jgi:di/tricarboxylate transporter